MSEAVSKIKIDLEKLDVLAAKFGIDGKYPSNKLDGLFDMLLGNETNELEFPVGAENETKKEFFKSSNEEIKKAVAKKLGIPENEPIQMTTQELVSLASETSKMSTEMIIQDAIEAYSQTLVSKYLPTDKNGIGIAGSADSRIIEEMKAKVEKMRAKQIKVISSTQIFNGAGTSQQTFKNFLRRYGMTEFFYEDDMAIKVTSKNFIDFENAVMALGE